jgi:hypothetical protein
MERPSHREISGKLLSAKTAVESGAVLLVNAKALREDLLDLGWLMDELSELLLSILNELEPVHYRGGRPPQKSYEKVIKDCELYAFSWTSKALGCTVYFKFALKGKTLWIVSFHRERKSEGGEEK